LEKGIPGECYNVGGNNEMTNIDLVKAICSALDELLPESPHRPHEKLIAFVTDRPGHDQRYAIDASKIARELQWRPATNVQTGIRQTVRWYLDNRRWWNGDGTHGTKQTRLGLAAS
jgi:dTDP-glucose 4,6-dehydratase